MSANVVHNCLCRIRFEKNLRIDARELEELRRAVGWPVRGDYAKILSEGVFYITAHLDGHLVGFLHVVGSPNGDLLIHDVCVHPRLQRKGVGTRLVELALEACRELDPQGVNVLFEEKNKPFFERFGFRLMLGGYIEGPILKGKT